MHALKFFEKSLNLNDLISRIVKFDLNINASSCTHDFINDFLKVIELLFGLCLNKLGKFIVVNFDLVIIVKSVLHCFNHLEMEL